MPKIRRKSDNREIEVTSHSLEYCLQSGDYELCHILSDLDNSGEFEPIIEESGEIEESKEELNELEKELTMTSSSIKKKIRK